MFKIETEHLTRMVQSYLDAATLCSIDIGVDDDGEIVEIAWSLQAHVHATATLVTFLAYVESCGVEFPRDFHPLLTGYEGWERLVVDVYLTRNGHGAGFWDGDWPVSGEFLTAASKMLGESTPYRGDDGLTYFSCG
jgi:hypothetical protein